jgi:hypothetical protein
MSAAPQPLDLARAVELADRVLELVHTRLPQIERRQLRDWNDILFVQAFARAHRCLRSARDIAARGEGDDAAVLTRALVALTLRYLWLARVDDENERRDRLRRLTLTWARERALLGEELDGLGYVPDDAADAEQFRQNVAQFRARADELEQEGVRRMPDDKSIALGLDRDLAPTSPRFFELVYARIYRTTSDVAHYGIGAALAGFPPPDELDDVTLQQLDEPRAADALGLGVITFAALLDFSDPIIGHGLAGEVGELIRTRHDRT